MYRSGLRALAALLLMSTTQAALAGNCQILEQLPVEIDSSGTYCLDRDHDVDIRGGDFAIAVTASDVELDLQGHTVRNPIFRPGLCQAGNIADAGTGIRVFEARNVRIHGGALRCFATGIEIAQSRCGDCNVGNRIESMRIHESRFAGIHAESDFTIIADNQVTETGGQPRRVPLGIYLWGSGNTIRNNDVTQVFDGVGIRTGGFNSLVVGNRVQNTATGFLLHDGSGVRYRDNLTSFTVQPYGGTGDDLGNND